MLDIDNQMVALSKERPVFHSEADFQFAFAWQVKQAMPTWNIRLEFNPVREEGRTMALDIWIPTAGVAIELQVPDQALGHGRGWRTVCPAQSRCTTPQ